MDVLVHETFPSMAIFLQHVHIVHDMMHYEIVIVVTSCVFLVIIKDGAGSNGWLYIRYRRSMHPNKQSRGVLKLTDYISLLLSCSIWKLV